MDREETSKNDVHGMISRGRHRFDVPDTPAGERAQEWILKHSVDLLHGPAKLEYEKDELVVLVLVRNGRTYVETFVEHYTSLGAKHLVFLDNGSTDGTVEALQRYENVTVLRTEVPYKFYNVAMKRYLIERFGRERWTLSLDIDELFDYPYSDVVSLKAFLGYLNDNSYTAVVCYMLDLFSAEPLSGEQKGEKSFKERQRFYDLSQIRTQSYEDIGDIGNEVSNEEIMILKGGVQKRIFSISPLLTKHPLVFLDDEIRPMDLSDHWAGKARVADITGILLHYKLSASLYDLVRREMEERRYISRHGKYDKYFEVLEEDPDLLMVDEASKKLTSVNDLVGSRIVSVSKRYMQFVEDEERRTGRFSEEGRAERYSEAFFNARSEVTNYIRRTETLEKRLARLRGRLKDLRSEGGAEKVKSARKRERQVRLRAERAEKEIQAIQSSRSWRCLMGAARVKNRVKEVLGSLKSRGQDGR